MTLVRIVAFVVLPHTAVAALRVTTSLYALSNKASAFTVGVLMALIALVPMLLAVRSGRWIDQVGPRKPLLLGLVLVAGGALLPALFPYAVADIAPLLVSSVLAGTGFMYLQMTALQLVGHLADPTRRAASFSWLARGDSVSGLLGPVTSGYVIDHAGYRWAYVAALAAVAIGAALLWHHRRQLPHHWTSDPVPATKAKAFDLFRQPRVRNVLIASAIISMAWDLQTFMVPVYGTSIGLSASEIGWLLGSFAIATFLIRFAMPWLSQRFDEWQVMIAALAVAGVAYGLFPLFSSLLPLLAVSFLLGIGLGASQPNVLSLLHAESPPGRVGEALGLRTMLMNASHTALPLIFGAAGAVIGAGAVFFAMAALLGGGSAAAAKRERFQ